MNIKTILEMDIYDHENDFLNLIQYYNGLDDKQQEKFMVKYRDEYTDDDIVNNLFDDKTLDILCKTNKCKIYNNEGNIFIIFRSLNNLRRIYNKIKNRKRSEKRRFISLLFDNNKSYYGCDSRHFLWALSNKKFNPDWKDNIETEYGTIETHGYITSLIQDFYFILKGNIVSAVFSYISSYSYKKMYKKQILKIIDWVSKDDLLVDIARTNVSLNKCRFYFYVGYNFNKKDKLDEEYFNIYEQTFYDFFSKIKNKDFNFEKIIKLYNEYSYLNNNSIPIMPIFDAAEKAGYDVGKYKLQITV